MDSFCLLHPSQRPEADQRQSRYASGVLAILFTDKADHALILRITTQINVNSPNSRQHCVVKRHVGRKPNQPQKTHVDWMSHPAVWPTFNKLSSSGALSSEPIPPLGQACLVSHSSDVQTIKQGNPRTVKTNENCHFKVPGGLSASNDFMLKTSPPPLAPPKCKLPLASLPSIAC